MPITEIIEDDVQIPKTTEAEADRAGTEVEAEQAIDGADADGSQDHDSGGESGEVGEAGQAEEVQILIEGEAPVEEPRAPEWVRDLRKTNRELQRKVREYEEAARTASSPVAPQVTQKPQLQDFDYDVDAYDTALSKWVETKLKADEMEKDRQRQLAEEQTQWQARLADYGSKKAALKIEDFDEYEAIVQSQLDVTRLGVLIQGAKNAALVIAALGKNPAKLKEIAAIKNPVNFAFEIADLETKLKVTPRTPPPAPEKVLSAGTRSVAGGSDAHLERLREKAAKTGDMTPVMRYKQQLKAEQAKK